MKKLLPIVFLFACGVQPDETTTNSFVNNDCSDQTRSGDQLATDVADGEEVIGDFEALAEKKYRIDTCGSGTVIITESSDQDNDTTSVGGA